MRCEACHYGRGGAGASQRLAIWDSRSSTNAVSSSVDLGPSFALSVCAREEGRGSTGACATRATVDASSSLRRSEAVSPHISKAGESRVGLSLSLSP